MIGQPFGMVVPAISMSSRAVRVGQNWTDDSKRTNSSTPGTISSGRRRSFSRASPCRSRVSTLWAIRLTVVSWPLLYENRANPYPFYVELRKTPVSRQPNGSYVVSTYREIVSILHDPRVSSDLRKRPNAAPAACCQGVRLAMALLSSPLILLRCFCHTFGPRRH